MAARTSEMQLPLLQPEPISPLPVDSSFYVVAVQNKKGELDALRQSSATTWERMTPLVHLVGPLKKRTQPYPASTIREWVKRLAQAVGSHPVYLDLLRLDPSFPVETSGGNVPVLRQIHAAARKRGLAFVPVVEVGKSKKSHIDIVADTAAQDGQGVALRYRFMSVAIPAGTTRAALLNELLAKLSCDISKADLLLDLAFLDPDEDFDPKSVAASIKEMEAVGKWRSVVLLGTSIPKMMSCVAEGSVGSLPRREWELWTQLEGCGLDRMPTFGDYAIQHPHPPLEETGGSSMRANIRYTAEAETFVARGVGPVSQEGNDQYRDLCAQLVGLEQFADPSYTWGDGIISGCAKGKIAPGSQNLWRGAGTSHHLRFVTDQIRERAGRS